MSVEVRTTSRVKSALIAFCVLVLGLAIIFAIRRFRDSSQVQEDSTRSSELSNP